MLSSLVNFKILIYLGYGMSGRQFHSYLIKKSKLNLYGVFTKSRKIENERFKIFTSFEEVLNDENVNLIIIATPTITHFDLCINALNHKKNVIVDKPVCLKIKQFEEIYKCAVENKMFFSVFQNR
jgi:scyllo-inositol 2-dehydrogenase (NADP+)